MYLINHVNVDKFRTGLMIRLGLIVQLQRSRHSKSNENDIVYTHRFE